MKEDRPDINIPQINRRSFLKWSAFLGGAALSPIPLIHSSVVSKSFFSSDLSKVRMIRTCCPAHNCGGRCLLRVFVKDGVIFRIDGDDRTPDNLSDPQLRPCIRGRAYRRRQYHPDRLKYPMRRTGKRDSGQFERISWDNALDLMTSQMLRI